MSLCYTGIVEKSCQFHVVLLLVLVFYHEQEEHNFYVVGKSSSLRPHEIINWSHLIWTDIGQCYLISLGLNYLLTIWKNESIDNKWNDLLTHLTYRCWWSEHMGILWLWAVLWGLWLLHWWSQLPPHSRHQHERSRRCSSSTARVLAQLHSCSYCSSWTIW